MEKVKIPSVVFILLSSLKGRNDDDINYRKGPLSFIIVYLRFDPKFCLGYGIMVCADMLRFRLTLSATSPTLVFCGLLIP